MSVEKLTKEESFQIWNFQMLIVLKANGLYEVVSGELSYEDLRRDEEINSWKDAKAKKLMIISIHKKHVMHIKNYNNSKDMYDKVNIFERSTQDQVYVVCVLLQQFYNFIYE